jgi:hypothetical protein
MDYIELAKQFGGEVVAQQPQPTGPAWASNLSREHQAKIQLDMLQEGRKRLAELQGAVSSAGSTMADLENFGALNRKNSTGSWWQQLTPDKQMLRSPESMQMAAITARLAPRQRVEGSGATSDFESKMFLRGLPSTENEGPTNMAIRQDFQSQYDRAVAKANAMKAHLDKYGNLMDFDSQWAQRNQPATKQPAAPSSGVKFLGFEDK